MDPVIGPRAEVAEDTNLKGLVISAERCLYGEGLTIIVTFPKYKLYLAKDTVISPGSSTWSTLNKNLLMNK